MIEILPVKEKNAKEEILQKANLNADNLTVLAMFDKNRTMGYVVIEVREKTLIIHKLLVEGYNFMKKPDLEQTFILDSLMRAAASYGETNGADGIETSFPDFYDFFKKRRFDVDEDRAFTQMSTIVTYKPNL